MAALGGPFGRRYGDADVGPVGLHRDLVFCHLDLGIGGEPAQDEHEAVAL